jgi:hypothetical protein
LEHAFKTGAIGQAAEVRIIGEGGRSVDAIGTRLAANVPAEPKRPGHGDAPSFGAGELGGARGLEFLTLKQESA